MQALSGRQLTDPEPLGHDPLQHYESLQTAQQHAHIGELPYSLGLKAFDLNY